MNNRIDELMAKVPVALQPVYTTQTPNEPVHLFEGELQLSLESGRTASAQGKVELRWLPSPAIRFQLPDVSVSFNWDELSTATIAIPQLNARP